MNTTIPWGYPASVADNQSGWLSTYGPLLLVVVGLVVLAGMDNKGRK